MAYIQPNEAQKRALENVEFGFNLIRQNIMVEKLSGRRIAVALTHLETAEMYINKAIMRGDD